MLARKWRPQTFSDVIGQEHVLTALSNSLLFGRIHHAYLLSGTRGVGKTSIARLLAKGLNCETDITATPCSQCNNCREIEQGRFVDLIELDAASRTKVEDTRDLLENVQYAPARGRFKVYLIDEVHMLSRYSFNALLKTLEEPPAHVKFLLATTDPQKLPVTILSRCLQFHLKALDVEQIRGKLSLVLQQEHITAAPRALQLLARAAEGSMRDALTLTDQAIAMGQGEISTEVVSLMLGTLNIEQPLAIIEALTDANGGAMMALLAQCAARSINWDTLLLEILSLLHRLVIGQLLPDQLNDEEDPTIVSRLRKLAFRLPPADLQLYYQILLIGRKELPFAPDTRMGVEMTLLRALAFHPATVEAAVIPVVEAAVTPAVKKKMAEFSFSTRQNSFFVDSSVASGNRSTTCTTSLAGVNTPLFFKGWSSELPSRTPFTAPKKILNLYDRKKRLTAFDKNAVSYVYDKNFTISDKGMEDKLDDGVSEGTPVLNDRQRCFLPIGNSPVTQQATLVKSTDKNLIQAYAVSPSNDDSPLPEVTAQLLQARTALLQRQRQNIQKIKKPEPAPARQKSAVSVHERLALLGEQTQQRQAAAGRKKQVKAPRLEAYRWNAGKKIKPELAPTTTPKVLRTALEYKKTPELVLSLEKEVLERDPWAAQVHRMAVPKLVQQLALNAWKEDLAPGKVCLHLRASKRHLHSAMAQDTLRNALSADFGAPVELTVTEDNVLAMKTPLEWRQTIYEEKLMQAQEAIMNDSNIQILRRFFEAELDEDSIQPV